MPSSEDVELGVNDPFLPEHPAQREADAEKSVAQPNQNFHQRPQSLLHLSATLLKSPVIPWAVTALLVIYLLFRPEGNHFKPGYPNLLYSPAQDAVDYEVRVFQRGFPGDMTVYQGEPSPEVDKSWSDLYEMGISLIPASMASQLPNKTVLFPHDEERRYIIELDVFHMLHCLNMIRMKLRPDYYNQTYFGDKDMSAYMGPLHISHCVDALRQSVMCHSDISTLTWTWNEERQRNLEEGGIVHQCRRFDKIQAWARDRAVYEPMDAGHREMNDPLNPETWQDGYVPEGGT